MRVYLDDERTAPEGWHHVSTVEEVIELLSRGVVKELSLDHDLGTEKTGYDVLCWLEERIALIGDAWFVPEKIYLHTANPVGRSRMEQVLRNIHNRCESISYEQT